MAVEASKSYVQAWLEIQSQRVKPLCACFWPAYFPRIPELPLNAYNYVVHCLPLPFVPDNRPSQKGLLLTSATVATSTVVKSQDIDLKAHEPRHQGIMTPVRLGRVPWEIELGREIPGLWVDSESVMQTLIRTGALDEARQLISSSRSSVPDGQEFETPEYGLRLVKLVALWTGPRRALRRKSCGH